MLLSISVAATFKMVHSRGGTGLLTGLTWFTDGANAAELLLAGVALLVPSLYGCLCPWCILAGCPRSSACVRVDNIREAIITATTLACMSAASWHTSEGGQHHSCQRNCPALCRAAMQCS